jgi:hypothetical protein
MATVNTEHGFIGIFGAPGVGKTRLIGSSAEVGPTMIIRPPTDHTDSVRPQDKERIEERVSRDWNDMYELLDELRMGGWPDKKILKEYPAGAQAFGWLDSISGWQDFGLDDLFESAVNRKPSRKDYGPDQGEYGINMFRIGAWFRHIVGPDLFNFGFTAWTAQLKSPDLDEDGDPTEKLMPWVQGKNMSPKLCGYMNMVAYLDQAKSGKRILHVNSTDTYYAKDQFDALMDKGGKMVEPTMAKLWRAIEQSPGRSKGRSGTTTTTRRTTRRRIARKG